MKRMKAEKMAEYAALYGAEPYVQGAYDERAQIVADLRNEAKKLRQACQDAAGRDYQLLNRLAEKYEKAAHLSHLKIRPTEEKTPSQSMDVKD